MGVNKLEIKSRFAKSDSNILEITDCISNRLREIQEWQESEITVQNNTTDKNAQKAIEEIFGLSEREKRRKKKKEAIFGIAVTETRKNLLRERKERCLGEEQKDLVDLLNEWEGH